MSLSKDSKQKAWLEHYWRLLNVEFDWDPDYLSDEPPVKGPPIPITSDMVKKAISQTMTSKALGLTGIGLKIIWAAGDTCTSTICDLAAAITCDGKVLLLGAEFHCLPLQGQGACMEKKETNVV